MPRVLIMRSVHMFICFLGVFVSLCIIRLCYCCHCCVTHRCLSAQCIFGFYSRGILCVFNMCDFTTKRPDLKIFFLNFFFPQKNCTLIPEIKKHICDYSGSCSVFSLRFRFFGVCRYIRLQLKTINTQKNKRINLAKKTHSAFSHAKCTSHIQYIFAANGINFFLFCFLSSLYFIV